MYGSHIFRPKNFPDFSSIFFTFPVFYLMNFTNTKIYLTNTLQLKGLRIKNWLKFPHFSSILGKIPCLEIVFSFSSPCGNHDYICYYFQ